MYVFHLVHLSLLTTQYQYAFLPALGLYLGKLILSIVYSLSGVVNLGIFSAITDCT